MKNPTKSPGSPIADATIVDVTADFVPATGALTAFGAALDDQIILSRSSAGAILVNGGATPITGGSPTVVSTSSLLAFGQDGDDIIAIDETLGAMPAVELLGGNGDDTLTGGSKADFLFGDADNDTLIGRGGADQIFGDDGNDTIIGGDGSDQLFGGTGNDRFVWNSGDDSDLIEGGDGSDTAEIDGGNAGEVFTVTANGTRVAVAQTSASVLLDIGTTETIVINAGGGNDTITAGNGLAALVQLTIDGGLGNDTITGGDGADLLFGGDGNDVVTSGRGNDIALLGAGNDSFIWNPGDGSDTIEGQAGTDLLDFRGSNVNENIDISANGGRARFFRDVGNVTMDLNDVEAIIFHAAGGADNIHVNDMSGTDVTQVTIDLASTFNGALSDGQVDIVTAFGTAGNDAVTVTGSGSIIVTGLAAGVTVTRLDTTDQVIISGLAGDDTLSATALSPGIGQLVLDGGAGNDTLIGSAGADILQGGGDNDVLTGGKGADQLFGGLGDDRFVLYANDGNDTVDGGDGFDTAQVEGTSGADTIMIGASGTGVALARTDAVSSLIQIGTVENIVVDAGIGNDTITAGNGLSALTQLTINGDAGNDTITGGDGADLLFGGDGNDVVTGGRGSDVALLGAGNDSFIWNPGDGSDTIEGQAGTDLLDFHGSNVNENIDISANGGRARFFRDVGNVTMDVNDVEAIAFHAIGGADTIVVHDLAGTDVSKVLIDLAATTNGTTGDGQPDTVITDATGGNDVVTVQGIGPVTVTGLAATVSISATETSDRVTVDGLGGADTLSGASLAAGVALLVLDGGAGNDTLIGSAGADILIGGDDNDVLTGGKGADQLSGGLGNDRFVLNSGDGNDIVDGGDGTDTAQVGGNSSAETIAVTTDGTSVFVSRNDAVGSLIQIGATENVVIDAGAGNDMITGSNGIGMLTSLTIDGGDGNDSITGGDGADQLFGGNGDDTVAGARGNDVAQLGAGNDVFVWNPGDGSDTVEGGIGADTLLFNGANVNEHIDISANGGRARFFRDVANITMDLNDVETIAFHALGGADTITVGSMAGTDVKQIAIDLGASGGGGDGQADTVIVNGTASNDAMTLSGSGGAIAVTGLAASVSITQSEAGDALIITTGAGNDTVSAAGLAAGSTQLAIETGIGNDTIVGSQGSDQILAGDGADTVTGGKGDDVILLGTGNDHAIWNAGDGSDTIEGQDGIDKLDLNGAATSDTFVVLANGSRIAISTGSGVLDIDGIETLVIRGGGGKDVIGIGDLTGTDRPQLTVDLAATPGGATADGVSDFVDFGGSTGNDIVKLSGSGGSVSTAGLSTGISVIHADGTDLIAVEAGAGNDMVTAALLTGVNVALDGGTGDDILTGSTGNDQLFGGNDNDIVTGGKGTDSIFLGAGDDRYLWASGDGSDTVEGQAGADTLSIVGATTHDAMTLSANGARALLTDAVAAAAIDMAGIETVTIVTEAGADDIVVNDLTGTEIGQVIINLAATPSGNTGDHSIDHVTINATGGADLVELRAQAGGIVALGLNTPASITHTDATDQILVNGGGGDDLLLVSDPPATSGKFFLDGGSGNDTLFGGLGDDTIVGGAGADRMDGGNGFDTLDYGLSGAGVTVDLGLGTGTGSDATGDTISGFERLLGSSFNDILTGSAAIDQIFGGNGVDSLSGLAGNDILQGDAGNDRLTGGAGADQLRGGLGADRFVLLDASDSTGAVRDKIADFHHAEGDRIDLSAIDANPAAGGNNGFIFLGTGAFDGGKGELNVVYGAGGAIVSGDIDGNKIADFSIIVAGVDAAHPLVSTDFVL